MEFYPLKEPLHCFHYLISQNLLVVLIKEGVCVCVVGGGDVGKYIPSTSGSFRDCISKRGILISSGVGSLHSSSFSSSVMQGEIS